VGTLEDMLRKSPDMGISLCGGLFPVEGNLVCGWGSYTGDFDRWIEGSSGGAPLRKGFLREGSFTEETERCGF
jgi:hypothetical protein